MYRTEPPHNHKANARLYSLTSAGRAALLAWTQPDVADARAEEAETRAKEAETRAARLADDADAARAEARIARAQADAARAEARIARAQADDIRAEARIARAQADDQAHQLGNTSIQDVIATLEAHGHGHHARMTEALSRVITRDEDFWIKQAYGQQMAAFAYYYAVELLMDAVQAQAQAQADATRAETDQADDQAN